MQPSISNSALHEADRRRLSGFASQAIQTHRKGRPESKPALRRRVDDEYHVTHGSILDPIVQLGAKNNVIPD
jgi:hypothetical protein